MMKIAIHGAEFFAYHGVYPGEQKIGNCFLVDIDVAFTPEKVITDDNLSSTVNYQQLYEIAAEEMKHPRKLIETVAQSEAMDGDACTRFIMAGSHSSVRRWRCGDDGDGRLGQG